MKKIINALLILALCSCGNSNKRDEQSSQNEINDGSLKAQNCDCRVFTENEFNWEGSCLDGYANGTGTLTWSISGGKYVGEIVNGKITGKGSIYSNENLVYEGDFIDGKYNGQGTLYENNIKTYQGSFVNGKKSGEGILYYSSGYINYEGEFQNNEPEGFGWQEPGTLPCG